MPSLFEVREERRRRAREAQRAEERAERAREAALERARGEEREREREQERRAEALARARELEQAERRTRERAARALERARRERRERERAASARAARAEESRAQQRDAAQAEARASDRRGERREEARAVGREAERRDSAREAARARQRDEAQAEERTRERREHRRDEERAAARASDRAAERRESARAERRESAREAARRDEAREEQRDEERAAAKRERARSDAVARAREGERDEERAAARRERARSDALARARDERAAERRRETRAAPPERAPAQRIPTGVLSGSLPWLRVKGGRVVDELDRPVVLRGVTVWGLERAEPVGEAFTPPLDDDDLATLADWGATAVALPIAQDLVLYGRGDAQGDDYLTTLDAVIAAAAGAGMYAIVQLALLSSALPALREDADPAAPNAASLDLWSLLARRYESEPAVLFDLFASPHDPEGEGGTTMLIPELTWSVWRQWLLAMIGEIRRVHPRALVVARGLDRGLDLTGFPLTYFDGTPVPNVAYAAPLAVGDLEAAADLERLAKTEAAAAFPWTAEPHEATALEALGRRLAGAGLHWIAGDWRGERMPLVRAP